MGGDDGHKERQWWIHKDAVPSTVSVTWEHAVAQLRKAMARGNIYITSGGVRGTQCEWHG